MASDDSIVEFRDVPGFPNYRAGSDGSIWTKRRGRRDWHKLTPHWRNYYRVSIAQRTYLVHYLILLTFVGPRPNGMFCCHNDGNPKNNSLSNLRWDTQTNNSADTLKHGNRCRGEKQGSAKVTDDIVRNIRTQIATKVATQAELADRYAISRATVCMIVSRKRWGHLE